LIANAPHNDKTYANQKKATQILEPFILQQPQHPGVAHYIIHADDNPVLAPLALDAAKHYSQIAPDSPHALHMPSHIFTRLGLWDDSIASNLASADSARKQKLAGDELHALDYLVYAYLQTGRITEARRGIRDCCDPSPVLDRASAVGRCRGPSIAPTNLPRRGICVDSGDSLLRPRAWRVEARGH
jgi:hypothetical protein